MQPYCCATTASLEMSSACPACYSCGGNCWPPYYLTVALQVNSYAMLCNYAWMLCVLKRSSACPACFSLLLQPSASTFCRAMVSTNLTMLNTSMRSASHAMDDNSYLQYLLCETPSSFKSSRIESLGTVSCHLKPSYGYVRPAGTYYTAIFTFYRRRLCPQCTATHAPKPCCMYLGGLESTVVTCRC